MDRTAEKSNARLRQKLALVLLVASIAAVALLLPKLKLNEKLAAWLGEQFVSSDTYANLRHLQKTLAADGSALRSVEISYSEDSGASSAKIVAYLVENEVADEPLARELARKVLNYEPDFFAKMDRIGVELIHDFDAGGASRRAEQHYEFSVGELKKQG